MERPYQCHDAVPHRLAMNERSTFFENDQAHYLSLNGEWAFQLGVHAPTTIPVPSAWEAHTPDKVTDGPATYHRTFHLPEEWFQGQRIWFEAKAISFAAAVRVNGQEAGTHQGMWSQIQLEVTDVVRPGENEIELE